MKNTKRFTKNDSGFVCMNCGREIAPLKYTSRNHCNYCLFSLHVDINPGDRQNNCMGILEPVQTIPDFKPDAKSGWTILFKCKKCKAETKNKSASDDNRNLLVKLTNPEVFKNA